MAGARLTKSEDQSATGSLRRSEQFARGVRVKFTAREMLVRGSMKAFRSMAVMATPGLCGGGALTAIRDHRLSRAQARKTRAW